MPAMPNPIISSDVMPMMALSNLPTYHLLAVLIGAGLILGVMLIVLVLVSRALGKLRQGASRFADGDLSQRVNVDGPLEVARLAESLNAMAAQLSQRLAHINQQRSELEAVLTSMVEGVLAVDADRRVIRINAAAARFFDLPGDTVIGRSVDDIVPHPQVQQFIADALTSPAPIQREISLPAPTGSNGDALSIEAQGAALLDADGHRLGTLIVLHDVTRLRQLEAVRRDFVANVSHEIKTPVTAIKGSAETLQEMDEHFPEHARRFLNIISRQADRLHLIVEDLLTLARVEDRQQVETIELKPAGVEPVLQAAVEACHVAAQHKRIAVSMACDPMLQAAINAPLLEQAVINLLDNAIKYSPEGRRVQVVGRREDDSVVLSVADQGPGIEPGHQSRIFERFYRTDRARSRALGGTGLGLAIVKHVAQVHRGKVTVRSAPGEGSTFAIHLPAGSAASRVAS